MESEKKKKHEPFFFMCSSPFFVSLTCSASSSMLPPALRATTSNLSACSAAMSRVWVPMEPVEPRMEKRWWEKGGGG